MCLFFPPKSPTEILKPIPQRRHASELLDFLFWSLPFRIHWTHLSNSDIFSNVPLKMSRNTQLHLIDIIFPLFERVSYLISDLISGGDKKRPHPLDTRQWSCQGLPIFSARRDLHHPYPRAFCTLPSFVRIKKPRSWPVEHLRYQRKIGLRTVWQILGCQVKTSKYITWVKIYSHC